MDKPDIVEMLGRYLERFGFTEETALIERARDEIVALRRELELRSSVEFVAGDELKQARAEALEEAALLMEDEDDPLGGQANRAAAIRALKEKPK